MKTLTYGIRQYFISLAATTLAFGLLAEAPTVLGFGHLDTGPVATLDQASDQLDVTQVKAQRRATDGLPSTNNGLGRKCADVNIGTVANKPGQPVQKNVVVVEGPVVQECP